MRKGDLSEIPKGTTDRQMSNEINDRTEVQEMKKKRQDEVQAETKFMSWTEYGVRGAVQAERPNDGGCQSRP